MNAIPLPYVEPFFFGGGGAFCVFGGAGRTLVAGGLLILLTAPVTLRPLRRPGGGLLLSAIQLVPYLFGGGGCWLRWRCYLRLWRRRAGTGRRRIETPLVQSAVLSKRAARWGTLAISHSISPLSFWWGRVPASLAVLLVPLAAAGGHWLAAD